MSVARGPERSKREKRPRGADLASYRKVELDIAPRPASHDGCLWWNAATPQSSAGGSPDHVGKIRTIGIDPSHRRAATGAGSDSGLDRHKADSDREMPN